MAEAYDVAVAPHCPLGPLALAACLQLAACTPNVAIQEISLGIHYNSAATTSTLLHEQGGADPGRRLSADPEGPGLGVDIDEEAVREADKDRHRWRNPVWRTRTAALPNGDARSMRCVDPDVPTLMCRP